MLQYIYIYIYIYIYYKSLHIIQIIKHMWLHHIGGANRLIIGLLWMVDGMKNVTTTGPSSVKGTVSILTILNGFDEVIQDKFS